MHVTSHELPLRTLTAHESHREKGSTRHGDWVPLDMVGVPAQFWFSYSLTFQTIPGREIHSLARQEVLVRRVTNLSVPLRLKLAFHMYVFQVRHPSSDFRKIRVHAEVHAKVIMPFHMSVTRHTSAIQSLPDAYFTYHYNLTHVKFLIMTQYPWGFPILERGSPKHTCL